MWLSGIGGAQYIDSGDYGCAVTSRIPDDDDDHTQKDISWTRLIVLGKQSDTFFSRIETHTCIVYICKNLKEMKGDTGYILAFWAFDHFLHNHRRRVIDKTLFQIEFSVSVWVPGLK